MTLSYVKNMGLWCWAFKAGFFFLSFVVVVVGGVVVSVIIGWCQGEFGGWHRSSPSLSSRCCRKRRTFCRCHYPCRVYVAFSRKLGFFYRQCDCFQLHPLPLCISLSLSLSLSRSLSLSLSLSLLPPPLYLPPPPSVSLSLPPPLCISLSLSSPSESLSLSPSPSESLSLFLSPPLLSLHVFTFDRHGLFRFFVELAHLQCSLPALNDGRLVWWLCWGHFNYFLIPCHCPCCMRVCGTLSILYIGVHLPQWALCAVRHGHDRRDHTARASAACKSMMIKTSSVCVCAYNMNTSDDATKQLSCCSYMQKAFIRQACVHISTIHTFSRFESNFLFRLVASKRRFWPLIGETSTTLFCRSAMKRSEKPDFVVERWCDVCVLLTCLWFPRRECVLLLFLCCPGFEGYSSEYQGKPRASLWSGLLIDEAARLLVVWFTHRWGHVPPCGLVYSSMRPFASLWSGLLIDVAMCLLVVWFTHRCGHVPPCGLVYSSMRPCASLWSGLLIDVAMCLLVVWLLIDEAMCLLVVWFACSSMWPCASLWSGLLIDVAMCLLVVWFTHRCGHVPPCGLVYSSMWPCASLWSGLLIDVAMCLLVVWFTHRCGLTVIPMVLESKILLRNASLALIVEKKEDWVFVEQRHGNTKWVYGLHFVLKLRWNSWIDRIYKHGYGLSYFVLWFGVWMRTLDLVILFSLVTFKLFWFLRKCFFLVRLPGWNGVSSRQRYPSGSSSGFWRRLSSSKSSLTLSHSPADFLAEKHFCWTFFACALLFVKLVFDVTDIFVCIHECTCL